MLLSRPFILLGKQSQRQREQMNDFSIRFESHSQQAWIQPFQMHQQHKQHNQLLTLIQYELQIGIESKKHVVTDRFLYDIFVGGFWPYSDRDEQGTYGHSLMHVIIPTTVVLRVPLKLNYIQAVLLHHMRLLSLSIYHQPGQSLWGPPNPHLITIGCGPVSERRRTCLGAYLNNRDGNTYSNRMSHGSKSSPPFDSKPLTGD